MSEKNVFEQLEQDSESKFDLAHYSRVKKNVEGRKDLWGLIGQIIELYVPRIFAVLLGIGSGPKRQ